ncbi:MAG: anaerobic ribonucleoside-triphosphate reductase activating protein [Spirochaetales bacterium]|nr:anaerobic ribonucleoside-triphosphate reductase activating protein [Spirochaetales bacterium]
MKIKLGGFLPTTLLDYPGEVASVLFLPLCNLTCPYCHNPSLVHNETETLLDIEEITNKIFQRRKVIGGVVITGGEPTLYQDLNHYINLFQSWGLKVKVDTNGTRPNIIKTLKPDYFAMDLKTSINKYSALGFNGGNEIVESLEWLKKSGIDYEIRTTAAPILFTKDDLIEMLPLLKGVKKYFITNFRNGDILNPEYNLNTPYTKEELEEFILICKEAGITCNLR